MTAPESTAKATPDLAALRALLADGRCLCSSAHTDWAGVGALLTEVEAGRRLRAAVEALAAGECRVTRSATDCTALIGGPFLSAAWTEEMCCLPCRLRALLADTDGSES
jgi:hypothetical protein